MGRTIEETYAYDILDLFENLLEEKDIDIPSDDREYDSGEARLFGTEYYEMEDAIIRLLEKFKNEVIISNVAK